MNMELPVGEPTQLKGPFTAERLAELLEHPGWLLADTSRPADPRMPDPFEGQGPKLIRTELAKHAARLGITLTVHEATIWFKHERSLYPVYEALRDLRYAMFDRLEANPEDRVASAVYETVKNLYTRGWGRMKTARPEWWHAIPAEAAANTLWAGLKVLAAGGLIVALENTDVLAVYQADPDAIPEGMEEDRRKLGKWKRKGPWIMAGRAKVDPAEVLAQIAKGERGDG